MLRLVLKPMAEVAGDVSETWPDDAQVVTEIGHFRRARTALSAQVQDVAKPDDELFCRLRIAYKRGAEWRDTTGSMLLVDKAAYDYADKITSPLPAAPVKQEGSE